MKTPIYMQAEAWNKTTGEKSAPLTAKQINLVMAIAGVAADYSGNAYGAATFPTSPVWTGKPNTALEEWLLLYQKHPEAVLFVMAETLKHIRNRPRSTKALAIRSIAKTPKSLSEIGEALAMDTQTIKKAGQRLNRLARQHSEQVGGTKKPVGRPPV